MVAWCCSLLSVFVLRCLLFAVICGCSLFGTVVVCWCCLLLVSAVVAVRFLLLCGVYVVVLAGSCLLFGGDCCWPLLMFVVWCLFFVGCC